MGIAQGFTAGLQAGGRGSGVSAGLKQVLANMKDNTKIRADVGRTQMSEQGANARTMLTEGYDPSTGRQMTPGSLPDNMQENYSLYKGKPYKIKSIAGEGFPGENQAMGIAYMDYVINNLKKSDPLLASELKVKWATKRREMASNMLGIDAVGGEADAAPRQPSMFDNFKQNLSNNPVANYFIGD